ncbi:MAG: MATE family efflux transporter [Paracoccaceae bacterium]
MAEASATETGKFLTGSLMRHVFVMSLAGAAGLSFTFLIDFLALWWISQRRIEAEMAAVGIAGTIQFAIISLAVGLMIATAAMVGRAIGEGAAARARRIATVGMLFTFAFMLGLSSLFWLFRAEVLAASGATGEALRLGIAYLGITLPSMVLVAVGILSSALLRTVGDAWRSMLVTMLPGFLSVILDPVLIVWMDWGIEGAAWSINMARVLMVSVGLVYVLRTHRLLARPRMADFSFFARPFAAIALPAIATQLSTPFGNWILTREVAAFGESAVAGWGVVMRLTILAFGGIFALSGAVGGIIAQNFGGRRLDRVEEAFWAALKFCLLYTLVAWALMALASGYIVRSFGLSGDGQMVVLSFTHWAAGAFIFTGAIFVSNACFNNLGRPLLSTATNWLRDGVLMLPLSIAMTGLFAETGVVWANGLANIIVGLLAGWLCLRYIRQLRQRAAHPGPSA